jgi:hypothetical protein
MVLKLKYTGVDITFEAEDCFWDEIEIIGSPHADRILEQINGLCAGMSDLHNKVQFFAGVSHAESKPFFYEMSVVKEHGYYPFFLTIREITTDEYLDALLKKKAFDEDNGF